MTENTYVQGHMPPIVEAHSSRNAANTCAYFSHLLKPHFHILDAGCGSGSITSSLASLVPQGNVIGVDSSASVIETAQHQTDLPANCTFQVASLESLPFFDATFDVVQTSQVLAHIPDVTTALRELRRVCKGGGFVACREGDIGGPLLYPMHAGLERWARIMKENLRSNGAHPDAGRMLLRWTLDAGFSATNVTYSAGALVYAGVDRHMFGETMRARMDEDQTWRNKVLDFGLGNEEDFALMRDGWKAFLEDEAAVFAMPCGQIVCYK